MEPRRVSIVSDFIRQRKYSDNRYLRQAELSARLEEGRQLQITTENIPETKEEHHPQRLEDDGITSLARADTTISPLDIHPGTRVASVAFTQGGIFNPDYNFGPVKPWVEPTISQQDDIERRAAVIQRADTSQVDFTPVKKRINEPMRRSNSPSILRWLYQKIKFKPMETPRLENGLAMTAALNATLGLEFLSKTSPDWLKRRQLYVLEYTCSERGTFTCDSNRAFFDTAELKRHLETTSANIKAHEEGNGVRLIHVRNSEEAFNYLDNAFAISSPEVHHVERGFREWMQEERDSRRTTSMTIRWRPGFDTNRHVICAAIGIDLGSSDFAIEHTGLQIPQNHNRNENQLFSRRRIAIYLQIKPSSAVPHPRVTQFNSRIHSLAKFAGQNDIVICEYSSDAWSELSHTPTLLALTPVSGLPVSGSAAVMASAVRHVFWEIVSKWQSQIAVIHQPFADLEDQVYGKPADMAHARQVWGWSQHLQTMLKLVLRHLKAIQTFEQDFQLLAELEDQHDWLEDVLRELKHVADTLKGDYIEPLEHMIDLMYKSVTIRDSRLSLELGTSLWRLSWITFIFLPMTFLVGFFGMNVGLFEDYPSIKWYFVALVPLAIIIGSFWAVFHKFGLDVDDDTGQFGYTMGKSQDKRRFADFGKKSIGQQK